jgi:hypothetical protein
MRERGGCGDVGRALIGRTFAFSCAKGGKSALQALPLYVQVPSAHNTASSLRLLCFHRAYSVVPLAKQYSHRPSVFPAASHSTKYVSPLVFVPTPTRAEPLTWLPAKTVPVFGFVKTPDSPSAVPCNVSSFN